MFIEWGSGFFSGNSLFIHPTHKLMIDTEFVVTRLLKLLPLALTLSANVISFVLSEFLSVIIFLLELAGILGYNIIGFLNQGFSIDQLYNDYAIGIVFQFRRTNY